MESETVTGISENVEMEAQENQETIKLKRKEAEIEDTQKRSILQKIGDVFKTIFARIVLGREGYMRAYERAEAREAAAAVREEHARQVASEEKKELKQYLVYGRDVNGKDFRYEVEAINEKDALDQVKAAHDAKIKSVSIVEQEKEAERSQDGPTEKDAQEQNTEDQEKKEPEQETQKDSKEEKESEEEKEEGVPEEERTEENGKAVPFTDPAHVYPSSSFAGQTQGVDEKYKAELTKYLSAVLCYDEKQIQMSNVRNGINGDHSYLQITFNSEAGQPLRNVYLDAYGNSLNQNFEYNRTGLGNVYETDFAFRVARFTQQFNAFYYIDKEDRTSLTAEKYSLYKDHIKEFVKEASNGERCMINDVELRMLQSDRGFMITLNGVPAISELPQREDLYKNNVQSLLYEKMGNIMTENVKELAETVGASNYMTRGSISDTVPPIGFAYINLGSEAGMTELIENSLLVPDSMQHILYPEFEEKTQEQTIQDGTYNPLREDPAFDPKDIEREVTVTEISDSGDLHEEFMSRDEMDDLGELDL